MATPQFSIGYVTGSVGIGRISDQPPRKGSINVLLFNLGETDEYAVVEIVKWTSVPKTEIVWKTPEPQRIQPREGQLIEYLGTEFDGTRYWAFIYVTSDSLVPSVEFMVVNDHTLMTPPTMVGYYSPHDLVRFTIRPHAPGKPVVEPVLFE